MKLGSRTGQNLLATTLLAACGAGFAATDIELRSRALERAREAVVGLQVQAVEGARSARTLGSERRGSGVLIGEDGVVLTIGYLVLEAESVELVTEAGRRVPARVLAYDQASGFGLVQALTPLGVQPAPFARSAPVSPAGAADAGTLAATATVVSGGDDGEVQPVQLVSRRAFSGYWEYHIEGALYTVPQARSHSGAALFDAQGELLGVGSLVVPDALGPGRPRTLGNMFVPVDLLKPILAELRLRGRSQASARPWLGLNCVEREGELRVLRVTDDSPADVAGLQPGDRIRRLDGKPVTALAELWRALWADMRAERAVELEIERDGRPMAITVQAVDREKTLRRAQGI
ncbi:MAG: S1C family serine protease [Rubrivivax sp.]|nr:S1C family serine protease [Rubrivivax sp.]